MNALQTDIVPSELATRIGFLKANLEAHPGAMLGVAGAEAIVIDLYPATLKVHEFRGERALGDCQDLAALSQQRHCDGMRRGKRG